MAVGCILLLAPDLSQKCKKQLFSSFFPMYYEGARYLYNLLLVCCRKDDYDLCSFCYGQMGNENDYIRMDRPMTYGHPFHFKRVHELVCLGVWYFTSVRSIASRFLPT